MGKLEISRIGVYGVVLSEKCLLLITQEKGPYANKFDLPGGGIEFGETIEQALRREFEEEVNLGFQSMELLSNLTTCVEFKKDEQDMLFHQIGLIYKISEVYPLGKTFGELKSSWVNLLTLNKSNASPFVLEVVQKITNKDI